ncbi:MAG: diacylglycerol/lipid kinase family protein [Prevotella sp.]
MSFSEKDTRWGILYCPKRGFKSNSRHRERLVRVLDAKGVSYDLVQSESAEGVQRLTRMLINNGYSTIIIVGGDTALNDAVNCLMDMEQSVRQRVALGLIPHGILNDFAKFWNYREANIEQTVDWLTAHRVRSIDLGCIRYRDKLDKECHRYFVNCVNIGFIADMMNLRRQTRSVIGSRRLSWMVSLLLMVFHRMDYKMRLTINSETFQRRVMNLCIGNGLGYGQTPNAVPYNGWLDASLVCQPALLQFFAGLWLLISGRFLNYKNVFPYRTRCVEIHEAPHALVSIDGRVLARPKGAFRITIAKEVIRFLIPE